MKKKKIKYGKIANGAIYILSKKGLNFFKKKYNGKKDFTKSYLPLFINLAGVYLTKKNFADIGSIQSYRKLI